MKRFRFALATVLRVSSTRVKLAQQELARAIALRNRALLALREAEADYRATSLTLIELETGRIQPDRVVAARRYLDRLVEEVALRQGLLKQAEEDVDAARARLVSQRQSEQSLQELRLHRWRQHRYQAGREEQRELDEVGTQAYLRQAGQEGRAS
ncbi:MAG: flagellar export protein FliJ [Bacillota bacterium]